VKLIVISPEQEDTREIEVLGALFAAGLERYHVRKPAWSAARLGGWLRELPAAWRPRLVLHAHHSWVGEFGLAGRHWKDDGGAPAAPGAGFTSRSCHDLPTLRSALGSYTSVFFGPLFHGLSKPGRGPAAAADLAGLACLLARRSPEERRTAVIGLGGITVRHVPRCLELGCDGAALLGAIWNAQDPVAAYASLQDAAAPVLA
jgi:thiamine-phosphate pyrophosphorylase